MQKSRIQLYTSVLLLTCVFIYVVFDKCNNFQMKSILGNHSVTTTAKQIPDWRDHPAPVALTRHIGVPPLRAVTYNIHSGFGAHWSIFASRVEVEANLRSIAQRIIESAPLVSPVDVIGLNEVDFHSRRSGWIDEAAFLADELYSRTGSKYQVIRGETWRRNVPGLEVQFGNALLVRHPVIDIHVSKYGSKNEKNPKMAIDSSDSALSRFFGENRGIMRVRIDFHDRPVDVLVTHLEALVLSQREVQAIEILHDYVRPGISTVLLGDMNSVPSDMTNARRFFAADRTHDILTSGRLLDARVSVAARKSAPNLSAWSTYPAKQPLWPLDGIFATSDLQPQDVQVIGSDESDHRGLLVSYRWLDVEGTAEYERWHDAMRRRQFDRILSKDLHSSTPDIDSRINWLSSTTGLGEMIVETKEKTMNL